MSDYRRVLATYRRESGLDDATLARLRRTPAPVRRRWGLLVPVTAIVAVLALLMSFPRERPVDDALAREAVTVADAVRLVPAGSGHVRGTTRALVVDWKVGKVDVEVTPNAGVELRVETDEGHVQVVGTAFTVTRDPLGTTVTVRRGRVAVACKVGSEARLEAGQTRTCFPRTAAGLLGRSTALLDGGASPEVALAAADLALAHPEATGEVRAEILSVRLALLLRLERNAEALAVADTIVHEGVGDRIEEARTIVTALRSSP